MSTDLSSVDLRFFCLQINDVNSKKNKFKYLNIHENFCSYVFEQFINYD